MGAEAVNWLGQFQPPGLAPLQTQSAAASGTRHGLTTGHEGIVALVGREDLAPRCFDDVFSFLEKSGCGGFGNGVQHDRDTPPSGGVGVTMQQRRPSNAQEGAGPTMGSVASPPVQESGMVPSDNVSLGELNMILKVLQQCVGEFPTIELGNVEQRPQQLQKWRYAVSQALEAWAKLLRRLRQ